MTLEMNCNVIMSFCSVIFVVIVTFHSSAAIHCFDCNSNDPQGGESCADSFDIETAKADRNLYVDCNVKYGSTGKNFTYCHKLTQDVEGKYSVVRSCGTAGRTDKCVDRTGTTKIKLKYCDCDFDGCNSASSLSSNLVPLALAVSLLAVRIRWTGDAN